MRLLGLKNQIGEVFAEHKVQGIHYDPEDYSCVFNILWRSLASRLEIDNLKNTDARKDNDTKTRTWFQMTESRKQALKQSLVKDFPGLKRFFGQWIVGTMATSIISQVRLRESKMVDENGRHIHPHNLAPKKVSEAFLRKQKKRGRSGSPVGSLIDDDSGKLHSNLSKSSSANSYVDSSQEEPGLSVPSKFLPGSQIQALDNTPCDVRKTNGRVSEEEEDCDISDEICPWPGCDMHRDVEDPGHVDGFKLLCSSCQDEGRTEREYRSAHGETQDDSQRKPPQSPPPAPKPALKPAVKPAAKRPVARSAAKRGASKPAVAAPPLPPAVSKTPVKRKQTAKVTEAKAETAEKKRKRAEEVAAKHLRKKAKIADQAAVDVLTQSMNQE